MKIIINEFREWFMGLGFDLLVLGFLWYSFSVQPNLLILAILVWYIYDFVRDIIDLFTLDRCGLLWYSIPIKSRNKEIYNG